MVVFPDKSLKRSSGSTKNLGKMSDSIAKSNSLSDKFTSKEKTPSRRTLDQKKDDLTKRSDDIKLSARTLTPKQPKERLKDTSSVAISKVPPKQFSSKVTSQRMNRDEDQASRSSYSFLTSLQQQRREYRRSRLDTLSFSTNSRTSFSYLSL